MGGKDTEGISKAISSIKDGIPSLLKVLEFVEQIHPFIKRPLVFYFPVIARY